MRFLFVVPPFPGHVNPLVAVAAELRTRGHVVAWTGAPESLAGEPVLPCGTIPFPPRPDGLQGFAALKVLWEKVLVPLAEAMAPGVEAAIEQFRPDVVVADQQAFAGALVAQRLGVPWATSASTSSELADPLSALPKVAQWRADLLAALAQRLGAPVVDPRFSPRLVLAFTTAALAGECPAGVTFAGPALGARPEVDFPWQDLDPARALVLVTLGTVNTGAVFLAECAAALRERSDRVQAVIADPSGTLDAPGALVRRSIPQLDVLARAAAVICHGGHNTVCEALGHGLPLVVAPIRDDQPMIADQVVTAGAGVRLRFGRAKAAQLGKAVDQVLDDPRYRAAAGRVAESFRAAGGAPAAADALEEACTPLAVSS
ncbi:MGT family glycosyltransferase [Amycolatopsis sulphurea]|uniref:MGT family glycosyltransferase n=1 Tax=Amycolatopsis sulphurea TaxID=76022 RepID=A0A2A9FHK6_9PSEU|nr:glycosyltransferase [Amycolatopsis sulphurea]PFG50947.1 MGT family glycosyltransferase [Amycolatopsis sulphurea]